MKNICDIVRELCEKDGEKYIYTYWNQPDHDIHDYGTTDERVGEQIRLINDEVEKLCADLKDTLVIVTADHGLVDVEWKSLCDYPEIAECLVRVPSIESRALSIFVKKGMQERFEKAFMQAFGDDYILFSHDEVIKDGLFGDGKANSRFEDFVGDYVAVAKGKTKAMVMETLVMFGDIFGAKRLVEVTHKEGHLVTSFGIGLLKPLYKTMDRLIADGIKTQGTFTVDPRPLDRANVKYSLLDRLVNEKVMYSQQKRYEEQLKAVGLKDANAFTCACYLDEVGNVPKKGDVLSWAESSAVVYANSVLGARCNRNSGMLDLFGSIMVTSRIRSSHRRRQKSNLDCQGRNDKNPRSANSRQRNRHESR